MTEQSHAHHNLADMSLSASESLGQWRPDSRATDSPGEHVSHDAPSWTLAGRRVLVADDEPVYRQRVRAMLSRCGCRIDIARDGAQACELLADNKYDLVISDISMPGATGYEVFTAAKAAHHDTGVVLMTAFSYDPSHSVVKARNEGAVDVLLKPFQAEDLLDRCHGLLAGAEA